MEEAGGGGGEEADGAANDGEGEAEELDQESSEGELGTEHGTGPAVIGDVAGFGEGFGGADIRELVVDADFGKGMGNEDAGSEQEGTEGGVTSGRETFYDLF